MKSKTIKKPNKAGLPIRKGQPGAIKGQPHKYTPEIRDRICALVATGEYNQKEVCKLVGINNDTIWEWKNNISDFSEALTVANDKRYNMLKQAASKGLMTLMTGKEYEEINRQYKLKKVKGKLVRTLVFESITTKFIMPNAATLIFVSKNLDKEHFQEIAAQVLNIGGVVQIGGNSETEDAIIVDED